MTSDTRHFLGTRLPQAIGGGLLLLGASPAAWACPACVPLVESGIYGENFARHLLLMVVPVAVLVAIAVGVYRLGPPPADTNKVNE